MAETPEHLEAMLYLVAALQAYFAQRKDVYVAGNQFMYWIEGNPRQRVAPDVYVVFGVPKTPLRPTWKIWEEGKAPDVIIELTSRKTASEDLGRKHRLYQRLGVKEYIMIDVTREYLIEPVILHRLVGEEYQTVRNERPNDWEWWVHSELLGLSIVVRAEDTGYVVRLWDPVAQRFLPTLQQSVEEVLEAYHQLEEARRLLEEGERLLEAERLRVEEERRRVEEERLRAEEQARRAEEQRLRAEQEARRAEEEARRAEEEARRAEEERLRAEQEARARAALEARLREVEEELRRLKGNRERAEG
jgi:Uma2 family endonuclease